MRRHRLPVSVAIAALAAGLALVPSAAADTGWGATAKDLRGRNGEQFTFTCPANGAAATVWGTGVYTDDSSVCTAAVHSGLITFARGGTVSIEIRAGQGSYTGSTSNGVTTKAYGSWGGSFVFASEPGVGGGTWNADAKSLRGSNGTRHAFTCPANGAASTVWGTGVYTDDSSVCTAAVHSGLITFAGGGTVTIEIRAGQGSYAGSTVNGVTTKPYGSWGGSFVVVGAKASTGGTGTTGTTTGTTGTTLTGSGWTVDTRRLRASVGTRFTFGCPAGGKPKVVWGTSVYTDDSSVCTAAVHAGRITFARGGTVTVELRAGQKSYAGSTRNGVTTRSYGPWPGSFVIVSATRG